jgi:uncharacterized protein
VIAYFDTSALIPLVIDEPTTEASQVVWDAADRVFATTLVHVEARAALARAHRLRRIGEAELRRGLADFSSIERHLDHIEIDRDLVLDAGILSQRHGLRAYDAVHLAGALAVESAEVVFIAGDLRLVEAAREVGLSAMDLNAR